MHYLAFKKLSTLLREITSKHHGNFYCLNSLHSFATKKKLELHEKVYENKSFCRILKMLKYYNLINIFFILSLKHVELNVSIVTMQIVKMI